MTLNTCIRALHVLLALARPSHCAAPTTCAPGTDADSAAIVLILEELRGYYRDLHDRNWTSIVTHFYPAKVTARFAVPDHDSRWIALAMPPLDSRESTHARGYCDPSAAVVTVGHWARVRTRRCSGEADELWMYSMSGRWKIIHLESGAAPAASELGDR
ncbi:MAG: hypothetical protein ABI889_04295 [Gemmatimonadota bacterium]